MERTELAEWIAMILVLVSWWPKIFLGYSSTWYDLLIYVVGPIVLIAIFVVRYRRVREGFEYSERIIDAQHKAAGRSVLGSESRGPINPYAGTPTTPSDKPREKKKRP